MSSVAIFPRKWARKFAAALHFALSLIVFLFFDLLDAILCVVFKYVDEFLEGKFRTCYCTAREVGEDEVSETLFGRRNVFRELGFLGFARKFKFSGKTGGFLGFPRKFSFSEKVSGSVNRWSDCGCESCLSWTKNGNEKLHVVVKDFSSQGNLHEKPSENVVFIHGFMGSSYFWTETVFRHITKNHYRLFAVDLLGFGKSPKPKENLYTLKDHVEMIEKSVIQPYSLNSIHLVAHSMGCIIALALAAKNSKIIKSITLVALPYFPSSPEGSSLDVLNSLAGKKLWPPVAFGSAVMSWYEHIGRCVCFVICKHHQTWEWLLKLLTGKSELPWKIMDITKHTHHSAWHSMHNVICNGSRFSDRHLETLINSGVRVCVMQGDRDIMVPVNCSNNMKMKFPAIDVHVIVGGDHENVIIGREKDFSEKLESIWGSCETIRSGK